KMYSIGKFSKLLGVTTQTLRNWDKENKLKPSFVTKGKTRYYSEDQFNEMRGMTIPKINKIVIGYCRVSSNKQKDDLARQVDNLKNFMIAKGYTFDIIEDVGSGIDYNKKGLNQLIRLITENRVEKVVVLYKDRLVRFGFELIENIAKLYGTTIEIIDNTEKNEEQELVEDLVQIVTVLSCRLQGKRATKAKKMVKELIADGPCQED
ncbi:IS607 family transposase, partial [Cetobacterium sp.]|uniref:IS607 family transposase n=1 Tax=Cetobacterium sp. TaxID=2071632 RepID=UPI003F2DFFD1